MGTYETNQITPLQTAINNKSKKDYMTKEDERLIVIQCTLAEMIDNDVLDHGIGGKNTTDGFTIGKRGKARFYMYDPTPNGFYKLYQQNEYGEIIGLRYVDANKTIVTVWRKPT